MFIKISNQIKQPLEGRSVFRFRYEAWEVWTACLDVLEEARFEKLDSTCDSHAKQRALFGFVKQRSPSNINDQWYDKTYGGWCLVLRDMRYGFQHSPSQSLGLWGFPMAWQIRGINHWSNSNTMPSTIYASLILVDTTLFCSYWAPITPGWILKLNSNKPGHESP